MERNVRVCERSYSNADSIAGYVIDIDEIANFLRTRVELHTYGIRVRWSAELARLEF